VNSRQPIALNVSAGRGAKLGSILYLRVAPFRPPLLPRATGVYGAESAWLESRGYSRTRAEVLAASRRVLDKSMETPRA